MDQVDGFDEIYLPCACPKILLDCVLVARRDERAMPDAWVWSDLPIEPI